jgi:hypothetical protein
LLETSIFFDKELDLWCDSRSQHTNLTEAQISDRKTLLKGQQSSNDTRKPAEKA